MKKKKYKFNQPIDSIPSGFIMGDIKGVVMHQDNDVSEQGCIIGSGNEVVVITKDGKQDSKSSGIMSIPSNEVWFETSDGEYYDPMYVQVEEEYGDTFPDLPIFDREKTQAANTGNDHIYKWVFTEDVTRINDGSTGMFTEDNYDSAALPISKVFLPVNYWQNVSELEPYLFLYCSDLESFTIPNSVTSIREFAFRDCSSLTAPVYNAHCFAYMPTSYSGAYTIPEGIKQIGGHAFSDCSSLTSITIPNSVTSIGNYTFNYCSSLTSVTIGDSVTRIGTGAFQYCSSLISITIPNSVMSIGDAAFEGCTSLTSITIPNSVTSIEMYAFLNCSKLTSITIPNNVTSIGQGAFSGCNSLTSITCEAITPPTLGSSNNRSSVTAVYVPAESVEAYKTATNWSYYSDKIQAIL